MATWRKALVAGLAVLVGAVPVFARVEAGMQVATPEVQQTSVPLPQGDELGDDELLQTEGEFWWFLLFAMLGAGVRLVQEQWFDEDYGVDRDDRRRIARDALIAGVGGKSLESILAFLALIR